MMQPIGSPLLWAGFTISILAILSLDLGVFHRGVREVGQMEALAWAILWIALALLFAFGMYREFGAQRGLEFLTGYVIEYALSVDNIFIFVLLFRYFAVPANAQHRVLFWGLLGALGMRAAFILAGSYLLASFHWIFYVFGAFLVYSGIRMLRGTDLQVRPDRNLVVRLFRRFIPSAAQYSGAKFFVRQEGRSYATPLLLVLVVIEVTDVVFATDSIPAVFGITRDPFIVFTSNILAVVGLRSLYFLLSAAMKRLSHLGAGLGLVLGFVGLKMLFGNFYDIPTGLSLMIIASLLGGSALISLVVGPQSGDSV